MRKFTQEEAQKCLDDFGYEIISEYKGATGKTLAKTKEGYMVYVRLNALKNGQKVNIFDVSNSYTIYNINLWCHINNKSFELVSDKYDGNDKKLIWKCSKCKEIFLTKWNGIWLGYGCPYCSGKMAGKQNCFAISNPKAASEWHPTKNGSLTPRDVVSNSHRKVWWLCGVCGHEWESTVNNRNKGNGCWQCYNARKCGEGNHKWKGGITPLNQYLRTHILKWKKESFRKYNYRCAITGKNYSGKIEIHHIYGFEKILQETMEILNLPIYDEVSKYTGDELRLIKDTCNKLHFKYGLGVCLAKKVHDEFHSIYGYGNNTQEQWKEFKAKYRNLAS